MRRGNSNSQYVRHGTYLEQSIKTIQEQSSPSGSIQSTTVKRKRPLSKNENESNKQQSIMEKLLATRCVDLNEFCLKEMKKDLVKDTDQLIGLCEAMEPKKDNLFTMLHLITIIFVHCPLEVAEVVLLPTKWITPAIQTGWDSTVSDLMTNLLTDFRRTMPTQLVDSHVRCIVNLLTDYKDTSAPLLC